MKYYRVKKDGLVDLKSGYTTIINELLTEKEKNKKFSTISNVVFDPVNISCRKTFFCFGARFEIKD